MKLFILLGALALCAFAARAQSVGIGTTVGNAPGINATSSINNSGAIAGVAFPSLPPLPPTQFRVTVTSGSGETFAPSAFMPYKQAIAAGLSSPTRSLFVDYRQALAEGIAELNAKPKSVAQAALENRREERAKAEARFVQDEFGRVVKQSD
jgi:hypothetical protein